MNNKILIMVLFAAIIIIVATACIVLKQGAGVKKDQSSPVSQPGASTSTEPIETPGGEFIPLDAYLIVKDPTIGKDEWDPPSYYPPEYGLLKDREYTLEFVVTHNYFGGSMTMAVTLPEEGIITEDQTTWTGTDNNHAISLKIQATKEGRWIVEGKAVTKDSTGEDFWISRKLIIYIAKTVEEIKQLRSAYLPADEEEKLNPTKEE